MRTAKNIYLDSVLSLEHCELLEKCAFKLIKYKKYDDVIASEASEFVHNIGNPYDKTAFFINDYEYKKFSDNLTQRVQAYYPEKLKYRHAYMRVYYNNSILGIHRDRYDLDLTLTVNVAGLQDWKFNISKNTIPQEILNTSIEKLEPKYIEKYTKDYESFTVPRGCGVVCYGRETLHWRDKLICDDSQYVIQIFYHWSFV